MGRLLPVSRSELLLLRPLPRTAARRQVICLADSLSDVRPNADIALGYLRPKPVLEQLDAVPIRRSLREHMVLEATLLTPSTPKAVVSKPVEPKTGQAKADVSMPVEPQAELPEAEGSTTGAGGHALDPILSRIDQLAEDLQNEVALSACCSLSLAVPAHLTACAAADVGASNSKANGEAQDRPVSPALDASEMQKHMADEADAARLRLAKAGVVKCQWCYEAILHASPLVGVCRGCLIESLDEWGGPRCTKEHALISKVVQTPLQCDGCSTKLPLKSRVFDCRRCVYTLCPECIMQKALQLL